MRTANSAARADRFLGVRLTPEELERLDRFGQSQRSPSRSEAVRALVRAADQVALGQPEIPVGLQHHLEEIIEDGWAHDMGEALTLVRSMGFRELSRLHSEQMPALRKAARDGAARRAGRRGAEREGRGLLER
ncbi:MAG: ribbon-helix-helix domain-containing protein [Thermoplasmata archaeon]|nr:ribbon-helix-helix domain-containing protein [Thermoplasmata archaeon]